MNSAALVKAVIFGTLLQLAMVIAGHFIPVVAALFGPMGMMNSLVAGLFYAIWAGLPRRPLGPVMTGGAVAGGVCAFLGILVSWLLGDVPAAILLVGTIGSTITGAVGGIMGGRKLQAGPVGD